MKVTVDTNVLVRTYVHDNPAQQKLAEDLLDKATLIAVSVPCLCELVWVLRMVYRLPHDAVAAAIRALHAASNVQMDRPAVEAGLALLDRGGDFADGVIALEGIRLGGETFVSFDKAAVSLLATQGRTAQLLA